MDHLPPSAYLSMKPTDLRQPVHLPLKLNFSKIAIWSFCLMLGVTGLAALTRARTLILVAEVVDTLIILFLLLSGAVALILRSIEINSSKSNSDQSNS